MTMHLQMTAYRVINNIEYQLQLQKDLAALEAWAAADWGMQFNASNSAIYVMSISRQVSQHRLHYMYQLCGVVLDIVQFSGEISWHLTLPRYVLVKSYTYYSNESPPETRFSPSQPERKSTIL